MSFEDFILEERFFHHFQPIFKLNDNRILGYEGLLRSDEFINPEELFELARKEKNLYELDSRSIHKAARTYQLTGYSIKEGKLFLNVLPSTLLNPNFPSFIRSIAANYLNNQQIVFEMTEQEVTVGFDDIKSRINFLKKMGFLIAIDDFGGGIFDIQKIIEMEPNYIKLDKYFSIDLNHKSKKQDIVKFLLHYCRKYNIRLILEGLETKEEIAIAKLLGIHYGQGYGLAKPAPLKRNLHLKWR